MTFQDFYNNHWWLGAMAFPAILTVLVGFPISYWASMIVSERIIFAQNFTQAFATLSELPLHFHEYETFNQFETMMFGIMNPSLQGLLSINQFQAVGKLKEIRDEFQSAYVKAVRKNIATRLGTGVAEDFYDLKLEVLDMMSPECREITTKSMKKLEELKPNKTILWFGPWPYRLISRFTK